MIRRRNNNMKSCRIHRPMGFTLIELLVVIAIISLLVSILLPSLQKARDLAKQLSCMSTQRQVALSCLFYAEDNEQCLPRPLWTASDGSLIRIWWSTIGPYFNDHANWPTDPPTQEEVIQAGVFCPGMMDIDPNYPGIAMSIRIPDMLATDLFAWGWSVSWPKLTSITQPTLIPLLADADDWHLGDFWEVKYYTGKHGRRKFDVERHMNGDAFVAVFCDAHAESVPSKRILISDDPEECAWEAYDFFLGE